MKTKTKIFLGTKLEQAIFTDLSIGEEFYNLSNVKGKIKSFDDKEGVVYIDWQGRKDGSSWSNGKCWKIVN
jgi:hypothetical protein